jgi:hypothetical protein
MQHFPIGFQSVASLWLLPLPTRRHAFGWRRRRMPVFVSSLWLLALCAMCVMHIGMLVLNPRSFAPPLPPAAVSPPLLYLRYGRLELQARTRGSACVPAFLFFPRRGDNCKRTQQPTPLLAGTTPHHQFCFGYADGANYHHRRA